MTESLDFPGQGISKYFNREEEAKLYGLYKSTGDSSYKDILVASQINWVKKLVRKFANANKAHGFIEDLFQVGILAVMHSLETFDPSKGRLTTYVVLPINIRLARYLITFKEQFHIPNNFYDQKRKIERARTQLQQTLGRVPNDSEVLVFLPISKQDLEKIDKAFRPRKARSFQESVIEDPISIRKWYAGLKETSVLPLAEEDAKEQEYRRMFAQYFRDRDPEGIGCELIISYLGIEDGLPKTLREVSQLFNLTVRETEWGMRNYKKQEFKDYAYELMGVKR